MAKGKSDWKPGRVTKEYRSNYDRIQWRGPDKPKPDPEGENPCSKE